ncbi:MAG: radical SAM protein [Helicobacteraceae bacterium]|jgi:wyosine [tRNA(Phe)-imidazoG37] synthetase (radical SAM superfamily)|nr:radical SAM protein [Helicobacteraceae bacterium]
MRFVFGPVSSRRFGLSLGVDLSLDRKRCNYDCLYCELSKAKRVNFFDEPADWQAIVSEVEAALKTRAPEKLTITANGEPTLYPYLDALIDGLNAIKGGAKLMILSNGSTIGDEATAKTLAKLDVVKLSLDAAEAKAFKKVDRPDKRADIEAIIEAMARFRARYAGEFVVEVLLVKGANDTETNFDALAIALGKIKPDRIDIGTIERPSAYAVQAVADETMRSLANRLTGLNARIIPARHKRPNAAPDCASPDRHTLDRIAPDHPSSALASPDRVATDRITSDCLSSDRVVPDRHSFDRVSLIDLLKRRSLSAAEAVAILDERALALLNELLISGEIIIKTQNNKTFYAIS